MKPKRRIRPMHESEEAPTVSATVPTPRVTFVRCATSGNAYHRIPVGDELQTLAQVAASAGVTPSVAFYELGSTNEGIEQRVLLVALTADGTVQDQPQAAREALGLGSGTFKTSNASLPSGARLWIQTNDTERLLQPGTSLLVAAGCVPSADGATASAAPAAASSAPSSSSSFVPSLVAATAAAVASATAVATEQHIAALANQQQQPSPAPAAEQADGNAPRDQDDMKDDGADFDEEADEFFEHSLRAHNHFGAKFADRAWAAFREETVPHFWRSKKDGRLYLIRANARAEGDIKIAWPRVWLQEMSQLLLSAIWHVTDPASKKVELAGAFAFCSDEIGAGYLASGPDVITEIEAIQQDDRIDEVYPHDDEAFCTTSSTDEVDDFRCHAFRGRTYEEIVGTAVLPPSAGTAPEDTNKDNDEAPSTKTPLKRKVSTELEADDEEKAKRGKTA